jgi:hypothetical protein
MFYETAFGMPGQAKQTWQQKYVKAAFLTLVCPEAKIAVAVRYPWNYQHFRYSAGCL